MSTSEVVESERELLSSSYRPARSLFQRIKKSIGLTVAFLSDEPISSPENSLSSQPSPNIGIVQPKSYWCNSKEDYTPGLRSMPVISVKEPIGQGSFGTVFRVSIQNERDAALKCIAKAGVEIETTIVKVKTEFRVWKAVSVHPNIISLLAFFETDRNWCFIMEHAESGSLSSYLKNIGEPFEDAQFVLIAAQLAHAIHAIHKLGYLHRDISCSNVLLTSNSTGTLFNSKLTDFGLSMRGLYSSSRCGSLAYMAPEVMHKTPYGPGADWWSYGILVYAMGAGRTPLSMYTKKKMIDIENMSRGGRYEVAKHVTIHISRKLADAQRQFLIDLLKEDPRERLGVIERGNFKCFKRHPFFYQFNWDFLDSVRLKSSSSENMTHRLAGINDKARSEN